MAESQGQGPRHCRTRQAIGGHGMKRNKAVEALRDIEGDAHEARADWFADHDDDVLAFRLKAIAEKAANAAKAIGGGL